MLYDYILKSFTSIYGKSLIVEESPLQGILHLHSVHCGIFGLQSQLLQVHDCMMV